MTRDPDGSRGAGSQGLAWSAGVDRVRAMIAAGDVEPVAADAALAARLVADARESLGAALAIVDDYPGPAFGAAYDACRKAATAMLERQGLRVRAGEGGHAKVVEFVRAQLGVQPGRTMGAMRRARNAFQYPSPDATGPTAVDARQAIDFAEHLIEAVENAMPRMGVFT